MRQFFGLTYGNKIANSLARYTFTEFDRHEEEILGGHLAMKRKTILVSFLLGYFGSMSCLEKSKERVEVQQAAAAPEIAIFDHFPAPCTECHEVDRPAAPHVAVTDCIGCHAYDDFSKPAASFNHNPLPSGCVACHEPDRPDTPTHPATGDCVSCHSFPFFDVLSL